MDDETNTIKWKQAINKYSLGGYHILASGNLLNDITEKITPTFII